MTRHLVDLVSFVAGLAVVCWIGIGYTGTNTLALAVTLLIAAVYVIGALELKRFHQATGALANAIAGLSAPPASLGTWLDALPASLRPAVRLRVEGERVALPGPALTPYLVGLLVLLGMLGTFLGMAATLRGTGLALESATDLQAIRASLASPVKGLGFAFGTSVAGVATSAMLGLLSALARKERLRVAQTLDARILTTLRGFTRQHQRETTLHLLQQQALVMPALVDRLQDMMAAMERQSHALGERLTANQEALHAKTDASYSQLAGAMQQYLKDSVAATASAAGAVIRPEVEATMASLARETASWHETVSNAVQDRMSGLSDRFEATTTRVAAIWRDSLDGQLRANESLTTDLRASLAEFTQTFETRSAALLGDVAARLEATSGNVADAHARVAQSWDQTLAQQQRANASLAANLDAALARFTDTFEQRSTQLLQNVSTQMDSAATHVSQSWRDAIAEHARVSEQLAGGNQQLVAAATSALSEHNASLLQALSAANAAHGDATAQREAQRLSAWTEALEGTLATLRNEWQQAGAQTASQQQTICDTLTRTALDISEQTRANASHTIAEISRLVQTASEAPKAAAEIIAELRQKLSDSMVRDNAMLAERSRLLDTLGTLLDTVSHAGNAQRAAVDELVTTSAQLLERASARLNDAIEAQTDKLATASAQVTGSAVEVASLGDAFGAAVQSFGESNTQLLEHLQRLEAALDKSMARSDEQLGYYVAQAREVVELSVMSQKQILENLQQLGDARANHSSGAA